MIKEDKIISRKGAESAKNDSLSNIQYGPPSGSRAVAKADSRQFVRIEFARSLVNIRPGESRHPWHWCIIVQDGHLYAISSGHNTLAEAVRDFVMAGAEKTREAEIRLAGMYAGPHERPYDLAVVNPENVADQTVDRSKKMIPDTKVF